MNNASTKGYSVDPITRKDLDEALDRQAKSIKEYISLKPEPVIDNNLFHFLPLNTLRS